MIDQVVSCSNSESRHWTSEMSEGEFMNGFVTPPCIYPVPPLYLLLLTCLNVEYMLFGLCDGLLFLFRRVDC